MEHPLPAPPSASALWRTAALFAASVAALELIALIALGMVALPSLAGDDTAAAPQAEKAKAPARRAKPAGPTATPLLPRQRTSVLVLNGNGRTGAAAQAAESVKALRYRIGGVGNAATQNFTRTIAMYAPGRRAEAARLARDLHISTVSPLDGVRAADLGGAHVALIVGS